MFQIASLLALLSAIPLTGTVTGTFALVASLLLLFIGQIKRGHVTGTGGFLFMSFLFFGMRAIYLVTEEDYRLFTQLFRISVSLEEINAALWWATAATFTFWLGSAVSWKTNLRRFKKRLEREESKGRPIVSARAARFLLLYQCLTLPVMIYLASGGRALYSSAFGAYAYDLPIPLQSGHIFAVVVFLERFLRAKSSSNRLNLVISGGLFLIFTWFMRDVSMFRGFYVAGVMIVGIAALQRLKPRVSYVWLIIPIVVLQPIFRTLGETRFLANEELKELSITERAFGEETLFDAYWEFYDSRGDMNILDTFIAAYESEPEHKPYIKSWLYAPVHIIPRKIWSGKPERGILQDLSFMHGAPYAPGIVGFFLLDGGPMWMLLSMFALGAIVGYLDGYVLSMRDSHLKACLLGILVVNSMFLTRFFLWQALWQAMYAVIPCILLQKFFAKRSAKRKQQQAAEDTSEAAQEQDAISAR